MTGPAPTLDELRDRRDSHARKCADLLHRNHVAEARRHAKESELVAGEIRARLAVSS